VDFFSPQAAHAGGGNMSICRIVCLSVLLVILGGSSRAEDKRGKGPKITDKTFRQVSYLLVEDPSNKSARDWSRLVLLYTMQTPNAAVVLGSEEMRWADMGKENPNSLLLLAAYAAGNIQAQLNSGVKRNDRYSGLLTLFRVYRTLQEKDEKFKIAEVDDMLALHQEDKLVAHLQKLEEKRPTKMTPAEEAAIRKLLERK
jgi:hypothetical protein